MACCGRDADEAAEVLQRTYEKVFSGRAKFDERSMLRTWLFGVIRLTALENRRFFALRWLEGPSKKKGAELEPDVEHASDEPSPSQSLAERERAAAVEEALKTLPARQSEILHLTFYEGLSVREAAEIMGISIGTAAQHYERGKTKLHTLLVARDIL